MYAGNGFFTVRLDGPNMTLVTKRKSAFVGFDDAPKRKKEIDPDWLFAMQLQREESRRSSRKRS